MTRVTFDSKALKKVRDIYSKRANEVAKNIAPTVYNIEVTTEDREITDSLATLNTVFKLTKKTITNREYVTFGNELSSKLIKLNKGSIAIISYICNNIKWCTMYYSHNLQNSFININCFIHHILQRKIT